MVAIDDVGVEDIVWCVSGVQVLVLNVFQRGRGLVGS
jgi:hypothetical protein